MQNQIVDDNYELVYQKNNDLLAMITHDLKSPMNAILGLTDHLLEIREQINANDECIQHLELIKQAGFDMNKLVSNILLMARIEAGKERLELTRIDDLNMLVSSIINTFKYEATTNNITILTEICPQLPDVYWDEHKIRYHVINNLISNALKFTPPGGMIKIRAQVDVDQVVIEILDNGPGIPESDRKRIFDRFERANTMDPRLGSHAGMGLYNAHLFVSRHNGRITVGDGLLGTGAGFRLALPPHPYYSRSA